MNLLRWILLLPSAYIAWVVALLVGFVYVRFLDWICPPELVVSGACTASWHRAAIDAGIVASAGFAAGLVMLTVILIAPSNRRLVAAFAFGIGSTVAIYMAYASDSWAAGAAVLSVALVALIVSLRTFS